MNLVKTSLLNSVAVAIKMAAMLGINKVLAMFVGPSGYAYVGQLQNIIQVASTLASGAVNSGIVKYTSEYSGSQIKQHKVWVAALQISAVGTLTICACIIFSRELLAEYIIGDKSLSNVLVWFAIALPFMVGNSIMLAVLNGKGEVRNYILCSIAGSLFSLSFVCILVYFFSLKGALIALSVYQSASFFITFSILRKLDWFDFRYFFGTIDLTYIKSLMKFAVMALTTTITLPTCQVLLRDHIAANLGVEAAGFWEAMLRISSSYLMFITMTLSLYFLPRLSALSDREGIRRELRDGYKLILPVSIALGMFVYLFRDYFILVLFTDEFLEMNTLFGWQMIGNTLKVSAWLLGYLVVSKALVGTYILSEVLYSVLLYASTVFASSFYGLDGTPVAYAFSHLVHFLFLYLALRRIGYL